MVKSPLVIELDPESFNWSSNGWNVEGHEGLYFDNTATGTIKGPNISGLSDIFNANFSIFGDGDKT
jgi:hypothetical protein